MRKFLLTLLTLLLVPQFALASSTEALKNLMDEYHYAMTVEWDQRDPIFAQEAQKSFEQGLEELRVQGLSTQQLKSVVPLDWKKIETEFAMTDLSNPVELRTLIERNTQRSKGAAWNGEVLGPVIVLGLLAAVIGWIAVEAVKTNREFDACVAANNGNEEPCIDR